MNKELKELLEFAADIATGAGALTLKYFKTSLQVEKKADGSPVTVADREAESYLRERIARACPDDTILGEEEGTTTGRSGRRWIVDPIDGTFSFVRGVPFYGVLVGLEIDGAASLGVVYMPALDEIVTAATGLGCYWNGQRAHVSNVAKLSEALVLCTDFGSCAKYGYGMAAENMAQQAAQRRTWGDCYGYVLAATGRAEVMLDPIMNVWDCAPLLPVMQEAGGTFTDWTGRATIHGGNAIATNGLLFDEVMRVSRT